VLHLHLCTSRANRSVAHAMGQVLVTAMFLGFEPDGHARNVF